MKNLSIIKRLKNFTAPRRISWIDPDTGRKFIAKTRAELTQKIVTYRAQNELEPIENLNLVLENYWCNLPENKHLCNEATLERGWMTYLKGGLVLVKTMLFDSYVDQNEADLRSSICAKCEYNQKPQKNNIDTWVDAVVEHQIGDLRSKHHDELHNCAVCSCVLKSKVWSGESASHDDEENKQLPNHCWAKRK